MAVYIQEQIDRTKEAERNAAGRSRTTQTHGIDRRHLLTRNQHKKPVLRIMGATCVLR
jgi:hypothetical protein